MESLQQLHKKKILSKLDEMQRYVSELEDITPTEEEYESDLVKKRACEKTVELAIECIIDICSTLVIALRAGVPSDESDIVKLLEKKRLLSVELTKTISGMKV